MLLAILVVEFVLISENRLSLAGSESTVTPPGYVDVLLELASYANFLNWLKSKTLVLGADNFTSKVPIGLTIACLTSPVATPPT